MTLSFSRKTAPWS